MTCNRLVFLLLLTVLPSTAMGSSLADYLAQAAAHHPALVRLDAEREAVAATRRVVTALPDPELRFGLMLDPVETRVGPQRWSMGFRQSFPWFGTLGLRGRAVDAQTAEASARRVSRHLTILQDVRVTWFELAWLDRAVATTEAHLRVVADWEDVARTRYASGEGMYADLMRIQMELGLVEDRLNSLRSRRPTLAADLNIAAGLPADTPVDSPVGIPIVEPLPDQTILLDRQRRGHPDLDSIDARTALFSARGDLAAKHAFPRLTLGLDYIAVDPAAMTVEDSGRDPVIARFGLSLPLWRGAYGAERAAAAASVRAVAAERRDLAERLRARLKTALYQYEDAVRRAALYGETMLPRARRAFESLLAAYGTGEAAYLDLIDVARMLLEYELARDRALADQGIAAAAVMVLVGDDESVSP